MDNLIIKLSDVKAALQFQGTIEKFKSSKELINYCCKHGFIAIVTPGYLSKELREVYTIHLVELTKSFILRNPAITSRDEFAKRKDTKKVNKLFFEYGVTAEIFPQEIESDTPVEIRSKTSLKMKEFYEVCQIQFHFEGSFLSFKKFIQRQYGSFAEYCIQKGYDINSSKWESDETALRVARKLGSLDAVKAKSKSLYNYLVEHSLLDEAFHTKSAS